MKLVFLSAGDVKLVKKFASDNGTITKTSYPNAYAFTSIEKGCLTLQDIATQLKLHGDQGHCLLKGLINRPLVSESRAGSTDPNQMTGWVCFDLDGAPYPNPDAFMADIGLPDVSYVVQYSASHGIAAKGLRCHIFALLDGPQHPAMLKLWLQQLNLTVPALRAATELTKTGCALSWPLDITTCQNDKLIYIAPPVLENIPDPLPNNRIQVVTKKRDTFTPAMSFTVTTVRQQVDARINELRVAAGMPKRKATQYKVEANVEYMAKPEQCVVTGIKEERGFMYLNLNNGDSWGYWHPKDNFEFIYNFKGEPTYKTSELVPEYYQQQSKVKTGKPNRILLAFRDFNSANYYNGWYDEDTDELVLHMARTETQLRHFMKQYGQELGEFVPDWSRDFRPHDSTVVDLQQKRVNVFRRSPYMKMEIEPTTTVPPICKRVIDHVLGNDPLIIDHFHNWMACVFQYLDRTYTGWILHGTQGTGKGVLMHKILMPLIGESNMTLKRMEELESEFTGFFENVFLVVIDEIQTSASLREKKITQKLKNLMVEPQISVRRMYREPYMAPNYANMIFTSNMPDPVEIPPDDRRFNVGNYQKLPLEITQEEIAEIQNELYQMYCYWMTYPADRERARFPLTTQGRTEMIETNMQAADVVARAILEGDVSFFVDQLPTEDIKGGNLGEMIGRQALTAAYKDLVRNIVMNLPDRLTREQLQTLFNYTVGKTPETPNKFTSYLRHHRIHITHIHYQGKTARGLMVDWKVDPQWLAQARKELA